MRRDRKNYLDKKRDQSPNGQEDVLEIVRLRITGRSEWQRSSWKQEEMEGAVAVMDLNGSK